MFASHRPNVKPKNILHVYMFASHRPNVKPKNISVIKPAIHRKVIKYYHNIVRSDILFT